MDELNRLMVKKCSTNLLRAIYDHHNITESDYDLIYNLTGREALTFFENVEPFENQTVSCYCNYLREFSLQYREVHGYLSVCVCFFGVVSNALNIIVLSNRDMLALPVNRILRWLATTDVILMLEYILFVFFYYFRVFPDYVHTKTGATLIFLHVYFTQIMHTISIFMTLTLACWRYSAIKYPQRNATITSDKRCNRCILIAYLLPVVFCLPVLLIFSIQDVEAMDNNHVLQTYYVLDFSKLAMENNELLFYIYFWIYFVVIKLLPCVILTVITCWLIRTLQLAIERRNQLTNRNHVLVEVPEDATILQLRPRGRKDPNRIDRSTNILIAVLILFIITELPQGILGLLSGVFGKTFFKTCYASMGEVMDILALVNGAVNFVLYCIMSKQFRKTFGQLFKPRILSNLMQTQEIELVTTNV